MRFLRAKRRQAPAVIIVALIDILIVLLIFMMVTTTFKHQQSAIKITLPESGHSAAAEDAAPEIVVIQVASEAPFLNMQGRPVTEEKLRNELAQNVLANPSIIVFIEADVEAPWGEIVKVRDAAKDANVKTVKAMTKRPPLN